MCKQFMRNVYELRNKFIKLNSINSDDTYITIETHFTIIKFNILPKCSVLKISLTTKHF